MALADGQSGHLTDHEETALYKQHGATAGTARPTYGSASTAATVCLWDGSVEPTNAVDGDYWWDTSVPVWKRKTSGTFIGSSPAGDAVSDVVATDEGTTSSSYTNLATVGPTVTVTTGTLALVIISTYIYNNTGGAQSRASFAISGATTLAASSVRAIVLNTGTANDTIRTSYVYLATLTAGSNTFHMKYSTSAGTARFGNRDILVVPLN